MSRKYNWDVAEKCFGKLTDKEIANQFDIPRRIVANRRIKKGISVVTKWSRYEHLLGTMPDWKLARICGIKRNAVTAKRIRSGIQRFNAGREWKVELVFCSTLEESFEQQVATPLGRIDVLTATAVYECKDKLRLHDLHVAIGQLICYSDGFPGRRKAIVCTEIKVPSRALAILENLEIEVIQVDPEAVNQVEMTK